MDKKYISSVVKREARPRSKRLRELGASGSSGSSGSVISGGDTIVASGSAALETDVTSNAAKTGHIETGQVLVKGMTFTQFVKALLFRPVPATLDGCLSTANDVEYGSTKGNITYTATRNGNGAMTKAYYDNDEKNKLEFSAENNGVQTAVRNLTGNYTQNETYKATVVYAESADKSIPETTLNNTISVNVRRKWFAGVVDAVPTTGGASAGAGQQRILYRSRQLQVQCRPVENHRDLHSGRNSERTHPDGISRKLHRRRRSVQRPRPHLRGGRQRQHGQGLQHVGDTDRRHERCRYIHIQNELTW